MPAAKGTGSADVPSPGRAAADVTTVPARSTREKEASPANTDFPSFCATAQADAACATTAQVLNFWGGLPLLDTTNPKRVWVLERERGPRAGQGDSVVSLLLGDEDPISFQDAADLSAPVVQQTVVTDPGPAGSSHSEIAEDLDGSDGSTKRWVQVGGRRMLHLATRDFDQLQFVITGEGDRDVYVEVTLQSGRFDVLRSAVESLKLVLP
jgi:hypothetical protein